MKEEKAEIGNRNAASSERESMVHFKLFNLNQHSRKLKAFLLL